MVYHMKTTLIIDDRIYGRIKEKAAREGRTVSELVDAALRLLLVRPSGPKGKHLPPLPAFRMGKPRVDVADREALYDLLDER